jgi:hypothetical protein
VSQRGNAPPLEARDSKRYLDGSGVIYLHQSRRKQETRSLTVTFLTVTIVTATIVTATIVTATIVTATIVTATIVTATIVTATFSFEEELMRAMAQLRVGSLDSYVCIASMYLESGAGDLSRYTRSWWSPRAIACST